MDRKKVETKLADFAREFGFILPDGSFPEPAVFSQLVATPYRSQLWNTIINKIQPKEKVREIRNEILYSKLKSPDGKMKPEDYILSAHDAGIEHKVNLWKKKEILTKKIIEKRKKVEVLKIDIYKKAELLQAEICRLAEIEKLNNELKEKLMISNLMIGKHKNDIEQYKKLVRKIKSFGIHNSCQGSNNNKQEVINKVKDIEKIVDEYMSENESHNEDENNIFTELKDLIIDRQSEIEVWSMLMEMKKSNMEKCLGLLDQSVSDESEDVSGTSLKSLEKQFMLDITENSLQAILNRTEEKVEKQRLKETIAKIEKLMFNESVSNETKEEISYMCPTIGDSLTGRTEKMSSFAKSLTFHGMMKRKEYLERELERLVHELKRNDHWKSELKRLEAEALRSSQELVSLREKAERSMNARKDSVLSLIKRHNELEMSVTEIRNGLNDKRVFEQVVAFTREIRKGMEEKMDVIGDMSLDAFRRIRVSPGKEIYHSESLPHCLDHYGGELKDFFCSTMLSPYEKPEVILATLDDRRKFALFIKNMLSKGERDLRKFHENYLDETTESRSEVLENNYRETNGVLSKILMKREKLTEETEFIRKILKSWLEQPFRFMVPDSVTIESKTLRHFEEKHQSAVKEIKYFSGTNGSFYCKS